MRPTTVPTPGDQPKDSNHERISWLELFISFMTATASRCQLRPHWYSLLTIPLLPSPNSEKVYEFASQSIPLHREAHACIHNWKSADEIQLVQIIPDYNSLNSEPALYTWVLLHFVRTCQPGVEKIHTYKCSGSFLQNILDNCIMSVFCHFHCVPATPKDFAEKCHPLLHFVRYTHRFGRNLDTAQFPPYES